MTRGRIALLGSAIISALICGAGAKAQAYDPYYDRVYNGQTETVIVHPYYNEIEKRQLTGRINGEMNPTEYTLSRPVSFACNECAIAVASSVCTAKMSVRLRS